MAMFAPTRPQVSTFLVEFRCGKLKLNQRMLSPDIRKGMLYIHQSDDQLMHLCWKDRNSGAVEDDLIIFPEDIEFLPVPECDTGRVFCLKFKNSAKRVFFWMQEPKSDKDEELCKKVNDLLNNPPPPGTRGSRAEGLGGIEGRLAGLSQSLGLANPGDGEMGQMQNMDQNQLMQLLNLMGGGGAGGLDPSLLGLGVGGSAAEPPTSTAPPATAAPARTITETPARNTNASIQLSDLQNILGTMPASRGSSVETPNQETAIDLGDVLSSANISFVTSNESLCNRLLPFLPTESPIEQNLEELKATTTSPQLRQAAGIVGMALQTGQLAPVLKQFNLPHSAVLAAQKADIQSFAEVLSGASQISLGQSSSDTVTDEASTPGPKNSGTDVNKEKDEKKGDPPENMDLD